MKNSVIIVAGGAGSRMGSEVPKQFLLLNNYPVLMRTISCFTNFDANISVVVVLPESQINYWTDLCSQFGFDIPHQLVKGGETRFHSVKNGLNALKEVDYVAVHDGVRPLVSMKTIENCFKMAEESGAAIPVLPVVETLRTGSSKKSITVDRSLYFTVQTPQVFKWSVLKEAYTQQWIPKFTDDASVVEQNGFSVTMVPGNRDNLKITHPDDLTIANAFLNKKKDTL